MCGCTNRTICNYHARIIEKRMGATAARLLFQSLAMLNRLRDCRDNTPAEWDALLAANPDLTTQWDMIKGAIADTRNLYTRCS